MDFVGILAALGFLVCDILLIISCLFGAPISKTCYIFAVVNGAVWCLMCLILILGVRRGDR